MAGTEMASLSAALSSTATGRSRFARSAGLWTAAALLVVTTAGPAPAQRTARDELAAFPSALPGLTRRVVVLPQEADEDALKVGVVVGRTMLVDCNRHIFGSQLETRTVEGWGYDYHVVTAATAVATTRMACPSSGRSREFVRSADEPLLRYNSRLPIVVFAAPDVEIRFRIWRAGPELAAQ